MRREVFIHFSFLFTFLVFIHLVKRWFDFSFYPLWIGGILGTFLPDIDHLLHVYIVRPDDADSLKVKEAISKKNITLTIKALFEGRRERGELVFHSVLFQVIFLVLVFLVVTSSGSIFGRGLVLGFALHLLVDQFVDLLERKDLTSWFRILQIQPEREKTILYWAINAFALLIFAFLL